MAFHRLWTSKIHLLRMAASNSSSSHKLQNLVTFLCRCRLISGGSGRRYLTDHRDLPPYRGGCHYPGLRFVSFTSRAHNQLGMEKNRIKEVQVGPAPPVPQKFGLSNWVKWLLGSIISVLLPLWKNKWDYLLTYEGKAEKVVEEVGKVAEVVEKVATTADKALEEVVNQLPDNSNLKEAAQVMEHASNVAAHDARVLENIINKVDDVRQDLEDLEKMVEPIVDKIKQGKQKRN